jgi:stearoyl-CoA desaturase (delta-9 desaturase)
VQQLTVAGLVVLPFLGMLYAMTTLWSHGFSWFDLVLAAATYAVTGFGVSIGFHRLFSHRSFRARRLLKLLLAVSGSLSVQGSLTSWVSLHRRHHFFSDRDGDPHSPTRYGSGVWSEIKGLAYAHTGWLFTSQRVDAERWSPDLLADRDLVRISAAAPLWAVLSIAFPVAIGGIVTRSLWGALLAGLWGGIVRMTLLHHVTWSINSICHVFGKQPFRTKDNSRNFAPLAILSFGESWHNLHHAFPALARHGVYRRQLDPSARLIRVFDQLGWATDVRWPRADRLATRLVSCSAAPRVRNVP